MSDEKRIVITYETLYEFLRNEKTHDEVQELPETFYNDVIEYLETKKREIKEHTPSLDVFAEQNALTSQAGNAVKIIREIFDRREKKILFLAMNKARTDSNIIDTSNLLPEETEMFERFVDVLKGFRQKILYGIFSGKLLQADKDKIEAKMEERSEQAKSKGSQKKVVILQKIPRFVGKEKEEYGPYNEKDVAFLPNEIAEILIKKGRAQEVTE